MLLSNTIALIILGTSVAGLIYYTSSVQSAFHTNIKSVEYKPLLKQEIINNLKSLLIEKNVTETGSSDENEYVHGICSLVVPPKGDKVVEQINLNLSLLENQQNKSFSPKRWSQFFPLSEWEFVSNRECRKHFKNFKGNSNSRRCLKHKGSDRDIVYAIARIILRSFPTVSDINIQNPDKKYLMDSKKVMFYLRADLKNPVPDTTAGLGHAEHISSQADIVWANDVGECHVTANNGKFVVVKFAGTGPGSTVMSDVINSPWTHKQTISDGGPNCSKDLEIGSLYSSTVQVGSLEGMALSTLSGLNAKISCNRNQWTCPKKIKQGAVLDGYDDLYFSFNVKSGDRISMREGGAFTFKKSNGKEWDGTEDGELDEAKTEFYLPNPDGAGGLSPLQSMPDGENSIHAFIRNVSSSKKGVSSACKKICQEYEPGNLATYFYPAIQIKGEGGKCVFQKDFSDEDEGESNRVRCTVCYTKACHRYGLGTFGPFRQEVFISTQEDHTTQPSFLNGLLNEALDSQLPECAVRENSLETHVYDPPTPSSDCHALTIDISKTKNLTDFTDPKIYNREQCDQQLPVLCFAGGQYRPATKAITKTDGTYGIEIVQASYKQAQKLCFDMGREKSTAYEWEEGHADGLAILLLKMWGSDNIKVQNTINTFLRETGSDRSIDLTMNLNQNVPYNFINNATRGMFLAPPTPSEPDSNSQKPTALPVTNKIKKHVFAVKAKSNKMWVAMEVDKGGFVMATPPYAGLAKEHPYALYFGKERNNPITLLKDESSLSGTGPYLALAHSIRWKGLYQEDKDTRLSFLCKHKTRGTFFVTQKKGHFMSSESGTSSEQQAHKTCKDEGGMFLPPLHGNEWAYAMLELKPNDPKLPFPDPLRARSGDPLISPDTTRMLESSSLIYTKEVPSPKAWVALKLKKDFSGDVLNQDGSIKAKLKDLRLMGDFSTDSIFNEEKDIPRDKKNMGIITAQGELKKFTEQELVNMDINTRFKKFCLNNKQSLSIKNFNEACLTGDRVVTEIDLKNYRHSIRFQTVWQEKISPTNYDFIINESILQEAIIQAKNKTCKNNALNRFQCSPACLTSYNTCKSTCNGNKACEDGCLNQACDEEHDMSQHTVKWFS